MELSGRDERGFGWSLEWGDGLSAIFRTRYRIPLSIAWSCAPCQFDRIVVFDNPALQFLGSAAITSADSDSFGSVFQLSLKKRCHPPL